mmetsp:Transcript_153839/g.267666  ORF Transcript_153839/g.267666 Transcript_153839/m.267666 type:complete len:195 (-) Transcript_153839:3-587(-)
MPPDIALVNARVNRVAGHKSEVSLAGKPAATRVKVVAHLSRQVGEESRHYTLVIIRLITGRSHQIRAHMHYLGHPVVCDAKYTDEATFTEDLQWCPDNFLHRYCLDFMLPGSSPAQVFLPLPLSLANVLAALLPICKMSAAARDACLPVEGGSVLPYAEHVRLPGAGAATVSEAPWPPVAMGCSKLAWHVTKLR